MLPYDGSHLRIALDDALSFFFSEALVKGFFELLPLRDIQGIFDHVGEVSRVIQDRIAVYLNVLEFSFLIHVQMFQNDRFFGLLDF